MKNIILSLFLIAPGFCYATHYYVSIAGNDNNSGTFKAPFKTISKVNTLSLNPGDTVSFNGGQTFQGSIVITASGLSGSPIVYNSYGSGKAIITGLSSLVGWSNIGRGIWQASCPSCSAVINVVVVNGAITGMGRFPNPGTANNGYDTITAVTGTTAITGTTIMTGTPNFSGAEVVIRKQRFIIDRSPITSQTGATINYTNVGNGGPTVGWGYFIQNNLNTLDVQNEWYWDNSGHVMKMYRGVDTSASVQVATVDTLLSFRSGAGNYVTFDNLVLKGANSYVGMFASRSIGFDFTNCDVSLSATGLTNNSGFINSNISSNTFINLYDCALTVFAGSYTTVSHNTFKYINTLQGGGISNGSGITYRGDNSSISYNDIDTIGYDGIFFKGNYDTIYKNHIQGACYIQDDGGGIYSGQSRGTTLVGKVISGNIISDCIGTWQGTNRPNNYTAVGIYSDDNNSNINIDSNTVYNNSYAGIYIHNSNNENIRNNICYNNAIGILLSHQSNFPSATLRNLNIKRNFFYETKPGQYCVLINTIGNDISLFGTIDSNYYYRPTCPTTNLIAGSTTASATANVQQIAYGLTDWQITYGYDMHTSISPKTIPFYTISSLGSDLLTNGTFNINVTGPSYTSQKKNVSFSWDNTKLDDGDLKVMVTSFTGLFNFMSINFPITGRILSSHNYIAKFSVIGSKRGALGLFLRSSSSYNNLTPIYNFTIDTVRREYEFIFQAPLSQTKATLTFEPDEQDSLFYLDNVHLYDAIVSFNKDTYGKFIPNTSTITHKVLLDDNSVYKDKNGSKYVGIVSIPPFTGLLLLKQDITIIPTKHE